MPEWKTIIEMPAYEVSDEGLVRKTKYTRGKRLVGGFVHQHIDRAGYPEVALHNKKRKISRNVHRLVMAAFVGPRPAGMCVNHKNGLKTDNRLANLEYVTPSENNRHAIKIGLAKPPPRRVKFHDSVIAEVRSLASAGFRLSAIAKRFKMDRRHVRRVVNGEVRKLLKTFA